MAKELKQNNMRKAKGSGFRMRSGNKTSFKKMGSSPAKFDLSDYVMSGNYGQAVSYLTPAEKAAKAAEQKAARQAEIDAFNAAGGLNQAQNFDPTTGEFNITDYSIYQPSVSSMPIAVPDFEPNNELGDDDSLAASSSDLQKELTDKLKEEEAEEYNPDAYQGSLYDYSVRKKTPMSKKRSPKGKRGYKMKRK